MHLKTYFLTFAKANTPVFFVKYLLSVTSSKIRIQPQRYGKDFARNFGVGTLLVHTK